MGITAGIVTAATTIGSAVIGNQAKQKAKGQAGQIERDSAAAQAAADAKLKQQHDENIQAQSQAGQILRDKLGKPLLASPTTPKPLAPTLLTPQSPTPSAYQPKTFLGQ